MSSRRTIVLLSAKRTGSTAVFRMFQKHPQVGVCHVRQDIAQWEPNFWNLAAMAIAGDPEPFERRFADSLPFLEGRAPRDAQEAFALWERVLDELGPIVFDKSPKYLHSPEGLQLLEQYMDMGADVRLLGLVRDAREAIASQFLSWGHLVENDSLQNRERLWLEHYTRLEDLQRRRRAAVFRLEDLSRAPACYAVMMLHLCGLEDAPQAWAHFGADRVTRRFAADEPTLRGWTPSPALRRHLQRYGYID